MSQPKLTLRNPRGRLNKVISRLEKIASEYNEILLNCRNKLSKKRMPSKRIMLEEEKIPEEFINPFGNGIRRKTIKRKVPVKRKAIKRKVPVKRKAIKRKVPVKRKAIKRKTKGGFLPEMYLE